MNWAHVLYASSILAVIVISGFVAAYSRRHRNTAGGAAFMWVSVLVCLLALLELAWPLLQRPPLITCSINESTQ